VFPLRTGPGRKKLYCRASCRQRAYERRKGLAVLPPPDRLVMRPGGPLAHLPNRAPRYEASGWALRGRARIHALRPAGYAEPGERRPTLCGLMRAPVGRAFQLGPPGTVCQTCARVAGLRPPARALRTSNELAAYRAQLDAVVVQLAEYGIDNPYLRPDISARLLFDLLSAA